MKDMNAPEPWIATDQVIKLLNELYADAERNDPLARRVAIETASDGDPVLGFYRSMRMAYMAIGWEFGKLLYGIARSIRAETIVEFGTSFGISTIFLASAIRDNGGGRVITTEFEPAKAERARENLAAAGVEEWVELRIGDARETLSDSPRDIDMVFLDGAKELYFDVLKLLEPHLRAGGIVASDNTDHDGLQPFLSHVRHPSNGYISSAIFTSGPRGKAHEISIRC
jgi:predicted O-methyltransferase YrrM